MMCRFESLRQKVWGTNLKRPSAALALLMTCLFASSGLVQFSNMVLGICCGRPLESLRELRRVKSEPVPAYVMVRTDVLAEHMHLGE
jgi:hypothetical protein